MPATARPVEADRVHLVEMGHRSEALGDVADFVDRGDVAIHRIDRLEANELGLVAGHTLQQSRQIRGVIVAENVLFGAAAADASDHRGMVVGVRKHHHAQHLAR